MAKKDKKKKEETARPTNNGGNSDQTKYSGSIALTKLQHVVMEKKNKKGKKIKCLVIPVDKNYLTPGKDGAYYLNLNIIAKAEQDNYGQNGFISQTGNKKWSECSEDEKEAFKALPILGNIKCWDSAPQSNNADTGGSLADSSIDEDDDLPF